MADVILHEIYPLVEREISKKDNQVKFNRLVSSYLDRNIKSLSTSGPVYRTLFLDTDTGPVYEILKINPTIISQILKKSSYIKASWANMANPFNTTLAMIIRYSKLHNNVELMVSAITYLTLSMYPSLHSKYFKFEPNNEIMEYTINNMTNKYKIKTAGTIWKALIDTTSLSDKTYSKNLIKCTDKDVTDYIQAFKTRLNSLLKKIAIEFFKNHRSGNYLNTEVENDDPNNFSTVDNNSFIIERLTNSIVLNLSINGPDNKIITLSSKLYNISVNDLRNTVNGIISNKSNRGDISKVINSILYLFLYESKKTQAEIKSNNFLLFSLNVYKRTNISNDDVLIIKDICDKWLVMYSSTYKRTNRVGTINSFKKALYTFFVLTIQYNA